MKTSPTFSLLLLLLLGFSQASPLLDVLADDVQDDDDVDISSMILNTNNGSSEMLLEGDMVLPRTRNAMTCYNDYCRWRKDPAGHVTVPFTVSNAFPYHETKKIERALQAIQSKTCIRFVPRQNEKDYISVENRGGCYSSLGRVGGQQVLSLARRGCMYHGVIQHEFLHALGFQHEQTRSDRDQHVRINWEYIKSNMAYNFYQRNTNNLGTPYDYSSIMHYGRTAFSTRYGKETITPIPNPNVKIGQRRGLSRIDVLRINRLYEC
uniref:Metalloendopeptidase n=1 Tax=Stomias nebulosus TaxID=595391 RepID=D2YYG8_9TELE|nr:hatching enzyme [Stomias nebulosus]